MPAWCPSCWGPGSEGDRHLTWDEETIAEHDKDRGTRFHGRWHA